MNNKLNEVAENLLNQLILEGKTKEEAFSFVSEHYETALNLKDQMLDFNYSEYDAYSAAIVQLSNCIVNEGIGLLSMGRLIPLPVLEEVLGEGQWDKLNKQQQGKILWELGFNTRRHRWFTSAGCFNYNGKRECGVFIRGSERLDREWLTKKVNDKGVASIEARYHRDRDVLAVLRGLKRDD